MTAEIKSIGAFIPEKVVSNDQLAEMIDTSDEWIRSHTGIRNRHIAEPGVSASDLGVGAAKIALDRANLPASEVDVVIVATATGDYPGFPSTACIIQDRIGAKKAAAFDILAGCTGFVYAVALARDMILGGGYRNILVVGTEVLSSSTNWKDRNTCVLFGDGAGAVVVSQGDDPGRGIQRTMLCSDGSGAQHLIRRAGGSREPFSEETSVEDAHIWMNGQRVYAFAVKVNTVVIKTLLGETGLSIDEIDYIVPHQANERIIQAAADRLSIPMEKFYLNIAEYANTSSASIPIALNELYERNLLNKGMGIMIVGFGAGLTYGGAVIRW